MFDVGASTHMSPFSARFHLTPTKSRYDPRASTSAFCLLPFHHSNASERQQFLPPRIKTSRRHLALRSPQKETNLPWHRLALLLILEKMRAVECITVEYTRKWKTLQMFTYLYLRGFTCSVVYHWVPWMYSSAARATKIIKQNKDILYLNDKSAWHLQDGSANPWRTLICGLCANDFASNCRQLSALHCNLLERQLLRHGALCLRAQDELVSPSAVLSLTPLACQINAKATFHTFVLTSVLLTPYSLQPALKTRARHCSWFHQQIDTHDRFK